MAGDTKGAWVTCTLSEEDARKCLVMVASLKSVRSEKLKVVLVSNTVKNYLREQLEFSFDFVIPVESSSKASSGHAPDIDLLRKHLLKFDELKKCIYISPNALAFQNPDSIFEIEISQDTPQRIVLDEQPIFLIKPSFDSFISIPNKESKRKGNKNKREEFLNLEWIENGLVHFSCDPLKVLKSPVEAFVNMEPFEILAAKIWINLYNDQFPQLDSYPRQLQPSSSSPLMMNSKEPIAIIGMSCRYPGANDLDEFWNLMINGIDAVSTPPTFRWLSQHESHSWSNDGSRLEAGFLKEDPTQFDYSFFGISPKAAMYMDPQTRLLLKVIWEGIEDAGLDPSVLKGSNSGVFTGSWTNDYKDVLLESGHNEFYRRFMGNSIGAAASGISMLLGSTGPSIATESGCSAAMVAVHLACKSLQKRETNIGLAAGVNLLLSPFGKSFLPGILSEDGRCKTFDAKADGFARAEGCGVLVLKRLSDAIKNRDKIWGLIRGSAVAQEGLSFSMGTPTVECEALAMERALIDADVRPEQVSYLETHGTGTPTGDPIEIQAISKAYNSKERSTPLIIGSVKTNVGHTESCSGITGIMKTILAMKNQVIPPHRNVDTLNPAINLDAVPATIPFTAVDWKKKKGTSRIAGVSSFGITGTDAHVIIEEAPPTKVQLGSTTSPELQLLKLSAKTESALNSLMNKFVGYLDTTENSWEDVSYTANIGRGDFQWRATLLAKSKQEAMKQLKRGNGLLTGHVSTESPPSICFLFTGQGSQYIGMGKQLFETCPVFQQHFEKCSKTLLNQYKIDISQCIWSNNGVDELNKTLYSQTSIFCIQIALVKLWESWGVKPGVVLGHSLGEYAAAFCAGILDLEDAIMLVAERSLLVDALPKGKMLVIRSDHTKVMSIMERAFGENYLDVAAINSEEQTVVAGDDHKILEFQTICKEQGLKCMILQATHAFHSKHMDAILPTYRTICDTIQTRNGKEGCKYISGVRGKLINSRELNTDYWLDHTRNKVNFLDASKQVVKEMDGKNKIFIEIGPQPILSAMLSLKNSRDSLTCLPSLKRNAGDWETITNSLSKLYLAGVPVNWQGFYSGRLHNKVSIPHYPFVGKIFWPENNQSPIFSIGEKIHPLLGTNIPNATDSAILQNSINLEELSYLKEHKVGTHVVFPAAGYLEMCLAAGYARTTGNTSNLDMSSSSSPQQHASQMKIENLCVDAPFALLEGSWSEIQTVAGPYSGSDSTGDALNISIFRKSSQPEKNWIKNASAIYTTFLSTEERCSISLDKAKFHSFFEINARSETINDFYERVSVLGLKFGEAFRSLEKVWMDNNNSSTSTSILAQVKCPNVAQDQHYIIHPIILDSMIQAVLLLDHVNGDSPGQLCLPTKIGTFIFLSDIKIHATAQNKGSLFVHVERKSDNNSSLILRLVNSTGNVLAVMKDVELISTTVSAFEAVLNSQNNADSRSYHLPQLWEEVWHSQSKITETLEKNICQNSGEKSIWMLFEVESSICTYLATRLASMGCQVIKIRAGKQFQKEGDDNYVINDQNKEDFFQLISSNAGNIEGLIYAWPLDKLRRSQEQLVRPCLYMAQAVDALNQTVPPRVIALTTGVAPINGALENLHSCLWGLTKCLQNERSDVNWRCIDIDSSVEKNEMEELVFNEILKEEKETQVALIGGTRYIPKLHSIRALKTELSLPLSATRFELEMPPSRTIGDLKFKGIEENDLDPFDVEVEIRSTALNFRDLFSVLKPSPRFHNTNSVGSDFAGVVIRVGKQATKWKVGNSVFGTSVLTHIKYGLPSHLTMKQDDFFPVPDTLTLSEAATLPTVFLTVYKSLILVAKIKSSDTILIHTASGGVGLCAIQIAKYFGAKIIATAGSKRKQDYLKSLGIDHVFNSRSTHFQHDILEVTSGRGVDIVLNTLTSEGFKEATLAACAPSARFVELSKLSIWSNEDVKQLRPDVNYTVVDVEDLEFIEESRDILENMVPFIKKGIIGPLPHVRFDGANIREALNYLQTAKHIGKVVCVLPAKVGAGKWTCPLFNERSTYLITGGLGGIGFEVAKWMLNSGAKNLVLAGRKPPSLQTQKLIDQLNEEHYAHIVPMQMDVGSYDQVKEVLLKIKEPEMKLPQLRGIMHCAGVITDAFTSNQTWDKFKVPLNPKVDGTLNLHQLTIGYPLEHFVLFSSITALFGTPGQGNYAAANCFQDSFAHYRHSMGLPATSINWGAWGEVGLATEINFPGLHSLSTNQGLAALEHVLKARKTQMCVVNVESFAKLSTIITQTESYVDNKILVKELDKNNSQAAFKSESGALKPESFWTTYDTFTDLDSKKLFIRDNLRLILQRILRLDEDDKIENEASMQSMGADSLMFVEIRNGLQSLLGDRLLLNSSIIRDSSSISKLASNLIGMIEKSTKMPAQELGPPTYESVNNLIRSDSKLPPHIKPGGNPPVAVRNIQQVLVTGGTGFLAPYILRDLCKRKEIQTIYCLIRPHVNQNVKGRLEKALKKSGLSSYVDLTRVECIEGEITRPNLGMSKENWEKLSSSVDAIFHIAAKVNYADYYREMDEEEGDTRKSNLIGVKNILEFSCSTKTKHVYYASSIIAVAKTDSSSGSLSESWQNSDDFDGVSPFAYPVSKFVCDLYMKEAVKRGIPCKSFRLPIISGDSVSGRLSFEQNHFMLRYLFMMRKGKMPSLPFPIMILPVDICSEVSLNIFFNEEAPPDVYNVWHNHPNSDFDFIQVAKQFGCDINITDYSDFVDDIQNESTEEKSMMALFKEFHKEEIYLNHHRRLLQGWVQGDQNYFKTNKLLKYEPDFNERVRTTIEYLQQDIHFAKEEGWFQKLGIKN